MTHWDLDDIFFGFFPALGRETKEDNSGFRVSVEVPGIDPKDISVKVEDEMLVVSGSTVLPNGHGVRMVARRFLMPEMAETEGISAAYKHGILTVFIPRGAKAKTREIKVSVE